MALRQTTKLVSIGACAGLAVWLYDHDFLLNAGGPNTRISDAILRVFSAQGIAYPWIVVLPLAALIAAGALIGLVAAAATRSAK